ncbi:MAG: metal-dependent transcriptional regulator [Candidatus Metalachnospira sp.]|nr:metal-dependent transcriptional regulator [Candidatus Metalachnospira sp.]
MAVTEAVENYLEAILVLSRKQPDVHAIDVCNYLGYSRPTISVAIKQMKENGLITVSGENHISLTELGLSVAESIYERHSVISELLMEIGVSNETALEDACKIEHDLSVESFIKIKECYNKIKNRGNK